MSLDAKLCAAALAVVLLAAPARASHDPSTLDYALASEVDTLAKFLAKKLGGDIPPTQAIIVFYNPKAVIEAKDAPLPAMHVKQFKEYLRKLPKGPTLSPEQISALNTALGV